MTRRERRGWWLFTSHGLVLLALARRTDCTIDGLSAITGLGRSTVLNVLSDLRRAEMVRVKREGRRNAYDINRDAVLLHPSLAEHKVGDLLRAFFDESGKN